MELQEILHAHHLLQQQAEDAELQHPQNNLQPLQTSSQQTRPEPLRFNPAAKTEACMAHKIPDFQLTTFSTCLLVILTLFLIISFYSVTQLSQLLKPQTPPVLPAVELTLISVKDCLGCFDISAVEEYVKQLKTVNLTKVTLLAAPEAGEFLTSYKLRKLPAAIITGNVENLTIQGFEQQNNALVFNDPPAPYYDTQTNRILGHVDVTFLTDEQCTQCSNIAALADQLQQLNVFLASKRTYTATSQEARKLIEKYSIKKLPTALFSKDALMYDVFARVWDQVGTTEQDGTLVLRDVSPPFKDIQSRTVKGIVDVTYLTDASCAECYNATLVADVLTSNFGIVLGKQTSIDVSTPAGKKLVEKYHLTLAPTALFSKEAELCI